MEFVILAKVLRPALAMSDFGLVSIEKLLVHTRLYPTYISEIGAKKWSAKDTKSTKGAKLKRKR